MMLACVNYVIFVQTVYATCEQYVNGCIVPADELALIQHHAAEGGTVGKRLAARMQQEADADCLSPDCALDLFAKRHQCPSAETPMPCFDASTHEFPAIHLHIPKMAGRTISELGPDLLGLPFCKWAPDRMGRTDNHQMDWGDINSLINGLQQHRDEMMQDPCFISYEGGWNMVTEGFGTSAPIVMTTLRDPVSWTISAIVHCEHSDGGPGIDDAVEQCFVERDNCPCAYFSPSLKVQSFMANEGLELAKSRLSTSIFGIVEHMTESLCLFDFQLGKDINRTLCDCTSTDTGGHAQGVRDYTKEKPMRPETLGIIMQEVSSWTYTQLYAYALELFYERVDVFEKETSVKLFCYDSDGHSVRLSEIDAAKKLFKLGR